MNRKASPPDEIGAVAAKPRVAVIPSPSSMREGVEAAKRIAILSAKIEPRRPFTDAEPDGYLESDDDWFSNNLTAVIELMEFVTDPKLARALLLLQSEREVIELCAKVAEAEGDAFYHAAKRLPLEGSSLAEARGGGCWRAAARIRALKD